MGEVKAYLSSHQQQESVLYPHRVYHGYHGANVSESVSENVHDLPWAPVHARARAHAPAHVLFRGPRGYENGHDDHNRDHDRVYHLCAARSREDVWGMGICRGEEEGSGRGGLRGVRDRNQIATRRRGVCVPTDEMLVMNKNIHKLGKMPSPQSSGCHRGQCACCASHDKHRRHHDGSRTQRKQSWVIGQYRYD